MPFSAAFRRKRLLIAIWIAKRCGVPLKIAAKVDAVDRDYFESEIRKLLAPPDVEYIGEISDDEKSSFLSGAVALLAPIAWPEPFGLERIPLTLKRSLHGGRN